MCFSFSESTVVLLAEAKLCFSQKHMLCFSFSKSTAVFLTEAHASREKGCFQKTPKPKRPSKSRKTKKISKRVQKNVHPRDASCARHMTAAGRTNWRAPSNQKYALGISAGVPTSQLPSGILQLAHTPSPFILGSAHLSFYFHQCKI